MAGVTLDKLPVTLALNGNELFWIYQQGPSPAVPWVGQQVTLNQIASWFSDPGAALGCTMRQLVAALAGANLLVSVVEALPSDVTNSYNIAWNHASRMSIIDPFSTGFLQPTLGYSTAQMQSLYAAALAYPA